MAWPTNEVLLAMAFDNTVTDEDTAEATFELAPDGHLPADLMCIRPDVVAPDFMDTVFQYYKKSGVTPDAVLRRLKKIDLALGMKELMLDIYNSEQEAIIISDSNAAFILGYFHQKKLDGVIPRCNIYTNPGCLDHKLGRFRVRSLDYQCECDICPPNLCKGKVLMQHMACRRRRGMKTIRIVYVGDGINDFCPCLRLGSQDIVFCRRKQPLEKALKCEMAKPADECRLYADIRFYDHAYRVRRLMRMDNVHFPIRTIPAPPEPKKPKSPCDPDEDEECAEESSSSTEYTSESESEKSKDGEQKKAAEGVPAAAPSQPA